MESNAQPPQTTQPTNTITYVQVDVRFLQMMLDYLKDRPYAEVHQLIDILTGRAQLAPPTAMPQELAQPANIKEYKPN